MKKYFGLLKQTYQEFSADKATRLGAALAYYTIFSIAPLLLIAIAVAGMVFGQEAAQHEITGQLKGLLGASAAKAIEEMITNAAKPKAGTIATIIGIVTLVFGASGVFTQLKDALNTIWNVPEKQSSGIMGMLKDKFLSISMVFGVAFLLLVSLVIDSVIAALGKYAGSILPGGEALWQGLQLAVSFGVVLVLFGLLFRYLPDTKVEWRDVRLGALVTALLFIIGKFALSLYLGKAAVGSSYGAAGSLIVLLVWIYWSAQILFFGAEFTQVYAKTHGSRIGDMTTDKNKPPERREAARIEAEAKGIPPKGAGTKRPVPRLQPAAAKSGGGGAVKLAAGGVAGLFLGAIVGGLTALVIAIKSVKKIFLT
jgi:membrane protein